MPTLALAGGGSSGLGRAIIIALLSTPKTNDWDVIILSRTTRKPAWLRAIHPEGSRVKVRAVDYLSIDSLAPALEGVDTLISVVQALDGTQATTQINLINAAVRAGCRRFAPSYWGWGPKGWENADIAKEGIEGVWEECIKYKDKLESAKFNAGAFMNYIGIGMYPVPQEVEEDAALQAMKEGGGYMAGEDQACQGLTRFGPLGDGSGGLILGLKNNIAEMPIKDDGSSPRITWTSLDDVGRFVVASLTLPIWEEWMTMVGETLTISELLAHAEAVTGKKFEVTLEKRAQLEQKRVALPQDDFMNRLWTEFKIAYIRDQDDEGVLRPVLNQLCPEVRPIGVRQYMEKFWTG